MKILTKKAAVDKGPALGSTPKTDIKNLVSKVLSGGAK